jgi:hypothetical protein
MGCKGGGSAVTDGFAYKVVAGDGCALSVDGVCRAFSSPSAAARAARTAGLSGWTVVPVRAV